MFGWLQFWGIGGQEEEMNMLRNPQSHAGMPPGPIKDEDDVLTGASTYL
jgi:hypothetical protein